MEASGALAASAVIQFTRNPASAAFDPTAAAVNASLGRMVRPSAEIVPTRRGTVHEPKVSSWPSRSRSGCAEAVDVHARRVVPARSRRYMGGYGGVRMDADDEETRGAIV